MTGLSYAPPLTDRAFDVRRFGAAVNDTTNDATAVQAAVNAAAAAGGGTVLIPGKCAVGSTITIPNTTGHRIRLAGLGQDASWLRKTFNGILLDWSGTATGYSTHLHVGSIADLTLAGSGNTGDLLRTFYMDNLFVHQVTFRENVGRGVNAVELFDSKFTTCTWESVCGNSGTEPAVHLRNSIAASGFGSGTDNCNMVWFDNCRFEDFIDGGIWLERGGFGSANPNGIFFTNMKFETHRVRGPALLWQDSCKHVHASHIEIYMGAFMTGITTPTNVIENFVPGSSSLRDVRITLAEQTGVVQNCIATYCAVGPMEIENYMHAGLAPLTAHVNNFGGPGKFKYGAFTTEAGTLQAGTLVPVSNPLRTVPFYRAGTLAVVTDKLPVYNDTGSTWSFAAARATVGTAPTGASLIVSVKVDGTQVHTLTIAAGATTSGLVTAPAGTVPAGSRVTADVSQVGSTVAGADLAVTLTVQSIS